MLRALRLQPSSTEHGAQKHLKLQAHRKQFESGEAHLNSIEGILAAKDNLSIVLGRIIDKLITA